MLDVTSHRAKARTVRIKTGQRVRGRVTVRAAGTSTYTQDPEGRLDTRTDATITTRTVRAVRNGTTSGPRRLIGRSRSVDTTINHYTGPGDSPGWDTTGSTTRRYLSDASGTLTATITIHDGQPATGRIQIADPNGAITTTLPLTAHPTVGDLGPITLTTEYGQPTTSTHAGLYGWHGSAQRPTSPTSGLIQMGVRMYNPATGQFLAVDPIPGGNTTPYTWPTDPVNARDTNGSWGTCRTNGGSSNVHYSTTRKRFDASVFVDCSATAADGPVQLSVRIKFYGVNAVSGDWVHLGRNAVHHQYVDPTTVPDGRWSSDKLVAPFNWSSATTKRLNRLGYYRFSVQLKLTVFIPGQGTSNGGRRGPTTGWRDDFASARYYCSARRRGGCVAR